METSLVWSFGANTCQIHSRFHIAYNISNHLQYIQSSCVCTSYRFYQVFAINQWLTSKIGLDVTKALITAPGASKSIDPIDPFRHPTVAVPSWRNKTKLPGRIGALAQRIWSWQETLPPGWCRFFDNQHIGEIAFCEKLIHWSFFEASFFHKNRFPISRIETHEASQQLLLLFNSQLCTNISSFQSATRATSVCMHGMVLCKLSTKNGYYTMICG